ncbi:MAG TPA: FkbM family methyltransferase [Xanthobacteraceae bacterium]|jgi:FkbM family methyltransferase
MAPPLSYAQRFEDIYLMRCFGTRSQGFYIDIGSGHPVYDNTSFAFYLKGWSGVTVEPNPWLARLSTAVRPRDRHVEALVGAAPGEATFYLVDEFHGLSTMVESHARAAQAQFGKASRAVAVPVITLKQLCEQHAPAGFDFLKVDVEGAEEDVLLNGDWQNFRPKVVVVEALAPYTLAPAWQAWEPFIARHGYRYVWFDSLNRYYLAEEASDLTRCFEAAPATFDDVFQFRNVKPALTDPGHPDHRLATIVAGAAMTRLPLLDRAVLFELVTAGIAPAALEQRAGADDIIRAIERLLGPDPALSAADLALPPAPRLRDVYAALLDSDQFRAACGRISASYAW